MSELSIIDQVILLVAGLLYCGIVYVVVYLVIKSACKSAIEDYFKENPITVEVEER